MKKSFVLILMMLIPILVFAQASGGQITRKKQSTTSKNAINRNTANNKYTPVDMEPNTYYLCINETWHIENGQGLCRKMAAKGYKTELVKDPDPQYGYHVCIKKDTNKSAAREFKRLFNDTRYDIAYVFYNNELIKLTSDTYITKSELYKYNVAVAKYNNYQDAQSLCMQFRDRNWPSEVYYDNQSQLYIVIALGTNDKKYALETKESSYYKNNYPNAWILCMEDGNVYEHK